MKRIVIALSVVASILAGCESMRSKSLVPFDATHPKIFINEEKYIVIDQEPIVIPHGSGTVVVLWEIATDGVIFDGSGITIETIEKSLSLTDHSPAPITKERLDRIKSDMKAKAADKTSIFPCEPQGATRYKCTIQRNGLEHGLYPYTVRVILPGGIKRQLDPRLMY
jgi:hypothetical protein